MSSYFNKLIEVCDKCFTASCWYGEFMCDNSIQAGTTLKTVAELKNLNLEHKDNWSSKKLLEIYGNTVPHGYKERKNE